MSSAVADMSEPHIVTPKLTKSEWAQLKLDGIVVRKTGEIIHSLGWMDRIKSKDKKPK